MQTDSLLVVELVEPPLVLPVADPTRVEPHQALATKVQLEPVVRPSQKSQLLQLEVRPRLVPMVAVQLAPPRLELPRLVLLVVVALDPRLDWSIVVAVAARDCSMYWRLVVPAPAHFEEVLQERLSPSMVRLRPNGRRTICPYHHRQD
jgi:hypothetical protein